MKKRLKKLFKQQNGLCYYCSEPMNWRLNDPRRASVEHLKPRVLCGTNDPENLVAACLRCNYKMNRRMQVGASQVCGV